MSNRSTTHLDTVASHIAPRRTTAIDPHAAGRSALLDGPIASTLSKLALPTMLVLAAQSAVNVAETYYVGLLGTSALAGVALVFPMVMLMMTMSGGGLGSGVASAVARAIGAGRAADADALTLHALVLAVVVGAVFSVAVLLGGPALYRALGGRAEALDYALTYSNYLFAAAIPVWVVNLLSAALRGAGKVKAPALITLIGALILIPVSPVLIFGLGPIRRLGIAGAGISFALYYGAAMVILLRYMRSGKSGILLRQGPLQRRLFAEILKVGVPAAASTLQGSLTVILVTGAVGFFGTSTLAGYGIASRLDNLLVPLLFGISSAVLTMVGVNIGAGNVLRAKKIAWLGCLVAAALAELVGVIVAVFPLTWTGMFSHDLAVLLPAAEYFRVVGPVYAAMAITFVLAFASQGAGHVLESS